MAKIRTGDDGLGRALEVWADELTDKVAEGVYKTAMKIDTQATELAPVDTGGLRQSIQLHSLSKYHAKVVVGSMYAPYVEYGTGVYATKGSRAKKIPWSYQSADGRWYTTSGQKPQPFWTPSLLVGERYFRNYFGG